MKILGIDPGTAIIGWGIIEEVGGKFVSLAHGAILTPAKIPLEERLLQIEEGLNAILQKYTPEEAAVEDLFFFNNQKTAISVAQARGVILLTLRKFQVRIASYTPLQVKQALTGYGKADKQQMQLLIKNILKLSEIPKPDDVADALAIALCHTNARKMRQVMGEHQL